MKIAFAILSGVMVLVGIGMMWYGYKINMKDGTKRYRPGNKLVNIGLIVVVASGLLGVMLLSTGLNT